MLHMLRYKNNPLLLGTLLLTATGLVTRVIGFFFRIFISHRFGEEAMGIYQLLGPLLSLSFAVTAAGIQTALSRYAAREKAAGNGQKARTYLCTGALFTLSLSLLISLLLYGQAEALSLFYLKEPRCAPLLRICSLSLPFAALQSCLRGYCYGLKKTALPACTQLVEQTVRVGSVFLLCFFLEEQGQQPAVTLLAVGMVLGDAAAFLTSFFSLYKELGGTQEGAPLFSFRYLKDLLTLSLPLTVNRLILSLLGSFEAASIPQGLRLYGYASETALSIYGVLTGMAFSLVFFPSAFTNSAAVLLLPLVSEAQSTGNYRRIKKTIAQALMFSLTLGLFFTLLFFVFGRFLGDLLFGSMLAGTFIRTLSFLCPFLYLHTTLSSILQGLGKVGTGFLINVTALGIRLGCVLFLIPKIGIQGYLWGMLLGELFSSFFFYFCIKKELIRFSRRKT
ncbi:MAG: polysaccharide biosynthesis protein [Lachnospiraceae bacterium]|nr:polysaccharide biosynthesis protein [Lachnospiraceae bacterium]